MIDREINMNINYDTILLYVHKHLTSKVLSIKEKRINLSRKSAYSLTRSRFICTRTNVPTKSCTVRC